MSNDYMDSQPLANVVDYCEKCSHIESYRNGDVEIGFIRRCCTRCKIGFNNGIYKADAIITALDLSNEMNKIKNPYRGGRVSKIPENTIKAIKKQHNDGISIRKIAENTGYNKNTVNKILKG